MSDLIIRDEGSRGWQAVADHAPQILMVFVNLAVAAGEYRVVDVVRRLTGDWVLAGFALLATGIPWVLWVDVAWLYRHANGGQRVLSVVMGAASFLAAGYLGLADYRVAFSEAQSMTLAVSAETIFTLVIMLTMANIVAGLLYFYIDPQIAAEIRASIEAARYKLAEGRAQMAGRVLAQARRVLSERQALEGQYGVENVAEILAGLQGVRVARPDSPGPAPVVARPAPKRPANPTRPGLPILQSENGSGPGE